MAEVLRIARVIFAVTGNGSKRPKSGFETKPSEIDFIRRLFFSSAWSVGRKKKNKYRTAEKKKKNKRSEAKKDQILSLCAVVVKSQALQVHFGHNR